jgi:hypothetical protein
MSKQLNDSLKDQLSELEKDLKSLNEIEKDLLEAVERFFNKKEKDCPAVTLAKGLELPTSNRTWSSVGDCWVDLTTGEEIKEDKVLDKDGWKVQ